MNEDYIAVGGTLNVDFDAVDADLKRFLDGTKAIPGVEVAGASVAYDFGSCGN